LNNNQQQIQELMINQSVIEKKNIDKIQKIKHDEMEKQQKIINEKNELENSITILKKKIIEIENNNKNSTCEYNIEITKIKNELLSLKNDNEMLLKSKHNYEDQIQESELKINNLELKIKEIKNIKNSLEEEVQRLKKSEEEITTQNENWEIKINNIRNESNLSKETYEEYISKQSQLIEKLKKQIKQEKKRKLAEKKTRRVEQENVVEKFQHLEKIIDNQQEMFTEKIKKLKLQLQEAIESRDAVTKENYEIKLYSDNITAKYNNLVKENEEKNKAFF